MPKSQTILIVGGGIAGLTTALCLAAKGFQVQLHEQAKALSGVGAGLQLSPNALRILYKLGLDKRLKAVASSPSGIVLRNAKTGDTLASVPLGATAVTRYGLPYLVVHRADLVQILAGECRENPNIDVKLGSTIVDAVPHLNGISVQTNDAQYSGRFLIAADGVWSKFRSEYLSLKPATFSGQLAWRGLVPAGSVPEEFLEGTNLWLAGQGHGVTYPIKSRQFLNVVVALKSSAQSQNWNEVGDRDELLKSIGAWSGQFKDLISPDVTWTKWPLFTSPPTKTWSGQNVLLIGDAAHAMLPYAAQGAAQAIEDAEVLALKLSRFENHLDAYAAFEKDRMPRIQKVQKLVAANKAIYHMGPITSIPRNLVMKRSDPEKLLARQDWLYNWQAS